MANTAFGELKKRVLIGFPNADGETYMAVEQAVNDALHSIALVRDFDELIVTDITNAATVDGQKTYNWITDWALTRPKKIYSIRLMDEEQSRKLIWVPPSEVDTLLPYAERISEGHTTHYTPAGEGNFEFIRIPDDAYDLYIRYSQWPVLLSAETDVTPYTNLDVETVFLAKDIANAYISGDYFDFAQKAMYYLSGGVQEDKRQPDRLKCAKPFTTSESKDTGEPWLNPFIRRSN